MTDEFMPGIAQVLLFMLSAPQCGLESPRDSYF